MITVTVKGNWDKTEHLFDRILHKGWYGTLSKYGDMGVKALSDATPRDSGKTANSWGYEIKKTNKSLTLIFTNSSNTSVAPVIILLQYGHGTKNGGYVRGIDVVNSALKPVFEQMADEAWKEVTSG